MSDNNNISAAIDAGQQMAAKLAEWEGIPIALMPKDGQARIVQELLALRDSRAENPRYLSGTSRHQTVASLIAHIYRFLEPAESVAWADIDKSTITAIYDYHEHSVPSWCRHRAIYTCPLSPEWQVWLANSGKTLGQTEFGEFLEEHKTDIAPPSSDEMASAAALLSMARFLSIRTKGEFTKSINPTTGEYSLVNRSEQESSSTRIPSGFALGIPVFLAGKRYQIEARLRFALADGKPAFAYLLYQSEQIKRAAFDEIVEAIHKDTGITIYHGTPELS
ncbi:MAG: DUF2303 family protein [Pseudomonadota bacterium]